MKSLLTIFLASTLLMVYSQTALRPQEEIEALKQENFSFTKLHLFPSQRALNDPDLPKAQGLVFNPESARQLLRNPQSAITIDIQTATASLSLELYQVKLEAPGYALITAVPVPGSIESEEGLHYRGVVKGKPGSIVALSIYSDEVMGMISTPEDGNLTLGKYLAKSNKDKNLHALYAEELIPDRHDFNCFTPDSYRGYSAKELEFTPQLRAANNCVNLYLEVDFDVYVDKGGLEASKRYVTAVFNEAATLYANEGIKLNLAQLYVWNTPSPYSANDAYGLLIQFKNKRAGSIQGDAGLLLSYKGGGGIAVVDGLCDPFNLGYAGIGKSYNAAPAYSFTVMVLAHELGHILGSQHTHVCVWNGNNTAIDGCAGFTDGGCPTPPIPTQGGTIMSYCHITQYGINFSLGFGPQPGNLIRNRIASATCISACSTTVITPKPGCGEISFSLDFDNYGNETSWAILDANNAIIDQGGPYAIRSLGQKIEKKYCLPAGCYTLRVLDSQGDGICCQYGDGVFRLKDSGGAILAEGGNFSSESVTEFCIDNLGRKTTKVTPPPGPDVNCLNIDFRQYNIIPYGDSQDFGTYTIGDNGKSLTLNGNAWKAIPLNYKITDQTIIEFEFRSTQKGEIQGIGLDNDLGLNTYYTFQLWGSQIWGYQDYNNYPAAGSWKKYTIPVGKKYTGNTSYLFFACDNDENTPGVNALFRNLKIYEKTPCSSLDNLIPSSPALSVFPNPANQYLNFQMEDFPGGTYLVQLHDLLGRLVYTQKVDHLQGNFTLECPTGKLPSGVYLYQVKGENLKKSGKVVVEHGK